MIDHIRRLVLERDTCPQIFAKRRLADWEFELMVAWTDASQQYGLLQQKKIGLSLEALLKVMMAR